MDKNKLKKEKMGGK